MEIRRVHPDDVSAVRAYADIMAEAERYQNDYPVPFSMEELREGLRNTVDTSRQEGYLGFVDGVPVATGMVNFWMADNLDKVWLYATVLPDHRNRGHGSEILDFVVQRAKEEGRTTLLSGADYPPDADESHPYRRFLTDRGFSFSLAEVHRVLELPADQELLRRLADEAAPHHREYTVLDFVGLVPEEMRADYCVLVNHIMVDAPSGDIEFEVGATTPETLVQRHEVRKASGRTAYITVAVDRDGVPVAHNVLEVPAHEPGKIFNQDTLVRRDHRGNRLGLAVKIRNLQRVAALHPDRTEVHTWNAASNAPMIAVNDAMGFKPVMYGAEYVRRL